MAPESEAPPSIRVYVDAETKSQIRQLAAREGRSMTDWGQEAFREKLDREENVPDPYVEA